MSILWTIVIGFIAGVIAKFLMPGKNEPSGFILTTILGIVGAFVATFLGQALGQSLLARPLDYVFSVPAVLLWLGLVVVIAGLASALPAQAAARLTIRDAIAYE